VSHAETEDLHIAKHKNETQHNMQVIMFLEVCCNVTKKVNEVIELGD